MANVCKPKKQNTRPNSQPKEVYMARTLCFAAHSSVVATAVRDRIDEVLGRHLSIVPWCLDDAWHTPPACDLYLASNPSAFDVARSVLPQPTPMLTADRLVNPICFNSLLHLPAGTRALIAAGSYDRAAGVGDSIVNAGIMHIDLMLHYPGCNTLGHEQIDTVIVAGRNRNIPSWATNVIDIGAREIAISTYIEVLQFFRLPIDIINGIVTSHMGSIFSLTKKYYNIERKTEALLQSIDEAVISIDAEGYIENCNKYAIQLTGLDSLLGKHIDDVFSNTAEGILSSTGQEPYEDIVEYDGHHILLKSNAITYNSGEQPGVVLIARPISQVQEMESRVRRTLGPQGYVARHQFADIIGKSAALRQALELAKRFAATDLSILLEGESGVGKELFAQSIHNHSKRADASFVALNFAALPESLAESELFGYEEGAFTGASKGGRRGLFEEAHGGTIFLDEIGEASLALQAKLLRVLEEHEVRKIGGRRIVPLDVRIIAAGNKDLDAMMRLGKFRPDLYYRLCACPLYVPPLRERIEDLPLLMSYFSSTAYGRQIHLDSRVESFLRTYSWPGNVRELQNIVNYLCSSLAPGETAGMHLLPAYLLKKVDAGAHRPLTAPEAHQNANGWANGDTPAPKDDCVFLQRLIARRGLTQACGAILMELANYAKLGITQGRESLFRSLQNAGITLSPYAVRTTLKLLRDAGCVETGVTKQGSRITEKGMILCETISEASTASSPAQN